jgi:8-oxo-dGTP pyrophosphatase MutT (NUDIX family)
MDDKTEKKPSPFRFRTVEQFSAGGAAFRNVNGKTEFALIAVPPSRRWQLPKGLVDKGETDEQAALREVREEAGIVCEIIDKIDTVEYWYFGNEKEGRVRFHKFVDFFLMKYVSGDVRDHDREVAEARWVAADEAVEMLAFDAEKEIIKKAIELLED